MKFLKTFACLITFYLFGLQSIAAQEKTPVKVLLKNGLQVSGYVDQNLKSDYISVTTNDGDAFVYNSEEIKKIKVDKNAIKKQRSASYYEGKGFEHGLYMSYAFSSGGNIFINPYYLLGYRFNRYFYLGVGSGVLCGDGSYYTGDGPLDIRHETYTFPSIFLDIKVNIGNGKTVTPIIAGQLGLTFKLLAGMNIRLSKKLSMDVQTGVALDPYSGKAALPIELGIVF